MFKVRSLTVATLLLLTAQSADAQTRAELQARAAEQRAHIDSLRVLYEQEKRLLDERAAVRAREDSARAERLDTARAGPFTIVGRARDVAGATRYFERAWEEYEPLVGSAATRLEGTVFVVRGDQGEPLLRPMYGRPRHYLLDLPSAIRYRDRARVVRAAIGKPLRELLPTAVQQWVGAGNFGAGREMTRAYRELAIGAALGAELCHDGDIASCMGVLGLTADTARLRYYSAAQIRDMVRRRHRGGADYERCVSARHHGSCVAFLSAHSRENFPPPPVSDHTRVVLLEHALMRGGAGSFERMIADSTASARAALEAASGQELPALVGDWRETLLDAHPSPAAWFGSVLLATLFWIGVLIMLAMRSTRWRIG